MQTKYEFTMMSSDEFSFWLQKQKVNRSIKLIQLHHTWQPDYSAFGKYDAFTLQKNMKAYHVNSNGWDDIAQHFSIFPDGSIVTGRNLNSTPIGIKGGNTGAICIENVGNFDTGRDVMTEEQRNTIITVVKALMSKFRLTSDSIKYHCWYTAGGTYLGDYNKSASAKTCTRTGFFGGNTRNAFNKNLRPMLESEETMTKEEKQEFDKLKETVAFYEKVLDKLAERIAKVEKPMIYNYIDENMPVWARPTIQKLVDKDILIGNEKGELGLSANDLKQFVVNDRAGLYG